VGSRPATDRPGPRGRGPGGPGHSGPDTPPSLECSSRSARHPGRRRAPDARPETPLRLELRRVRAGSPGQSRVPGLLPDRRGARAGRQDPDSAGPRAGRADPQAATGAPGHDRASASGDSRAPLARRHHGRRDDHPLSDGQRAAGRWRSGSDAHDDAAHRAPGTRPVPRPQSGAQRGASGLRDCATYPHGDAASTPRGAGAQQDPNAAALPGAAADHAGRPPASGDHGARQSLPSRARGPTAS
jgi:hypothetical protein